jgi:arylsulfatase A-like enzyme
MITTMLPLPQSVLSSADIKTKPNVLFICIDDQNNWTGCLGGHPNAKTPNIDRLAKQSLLFTNAYCPSPHCNPSRTSLLLGKYPSTTGMYDFRGNFHTILPGNVTLPRHFKNNGYRVIGAGKIFHRNDKNSWHQYMRRPRDPGPSKDKRPLHGIHQAKWFDFGPIDVTDNQMSDGKIAQWAVEQLNKKYDRPFFIGVGFFRPHLPWYAPKKYFDMHPLEKVKLPPVKEDDLDDVPARGKMFALQGIGYPKMPGGDHQCLLEHSKWREAVQAYLACCSFTDAQLGRVLHALKKSPYADNTVVVLWSDHGWHLGQKQHWRKHALWEQATQCYLSFKIPGLTKPASRCDAPVALYDIYPTLVEICGITPNPNLDGQSLMPLLKNPNTQWDRPAFTTYGFRDYTLRSKRWRYIRYADGGEELYDHQKDPREWTNLANDPQYKNIKKVLATWFPKNEATPIWELEKKEKAK